MTAIASKTDTSIMSLHIQVRDMPLYTLEQHLQVMVLLAITGMTKPLDSLYIALVTLQCNL